VSPSPRWWLDQIEQPAYHRLRQLRAEGLWDGNPPVPIDHVAEHLLNLTIVYDEIPEVDGEEILGCLRPDRREIVLNARHIDRFRSVRGTARATIGHECGHADLFALAAQATEQTQLDQVLRAAYNPRKKSTAKGVIEILGFRLAERYRNASSQVRTEALRRLRDVEREQFAKGADTPLERRSVDHYAATLLMPADLVKVIVREIPPSDRVSIRRIAQRFDVSFTAMEIRLRELGIIHGIGDGGEVLAMDPASAAGGQGDLFR
jgi:hypothetical protein